MSNWEHSHKHIADKKDPRVEIRNTFSFSNWDQVRPDHRKSIQYHADVLLTVRPLDNKHGIPEVVMSMNGKCPINAVDMVQMIDAIIEARGAFHPEGGK